MSKTISIHASTREYGQKMIEVVEEMKRELQAMQALKDDMITDGVSGNITGAYDNAFESNKDIIDKNSATIIELGSRLLTAQDMHEEMDNWAKDVLNQHA